MANNERLTKRVFTHYDTLPPSSPEVDFEFFSNFPENGEPNDQGKMTTVEDLASLLQQRGFDVKLVHDAYEDGERIYSKVALWIRKR